MRLLLHLTHVVTYHCIIILCLYYAAAKNIRGMFFSFLLFILHSTFVYDYNYVHIVKIYWIIHIFQIDYSKSCVI